MKGLLGLLRHSMFLGTERALWWFRRRTGNKRRWRQSRARPSRNWRPEIRRTETRARRCLTGSEPLPPFPVVPISLPGLPWTCLSLYQSCPCSLQALPSVCAACPQCANHSSLWYCRRLCVVYLAADANRTCLPSHGHTTGCSSTLLNVQFPFKLTTLLCVDRRSMLGLC